MIQFVILFLLGEIQKPKCWWIGVHKQLRVALPRKEIKPQSTGHNGVG